MRASPYQGSSRVFWTSFLRRRLITCYHWNRLIQPGDHCPSANKPPLFCPIALPPMDPIRAPSSSRTYENVSFDFEPSSHRQAGDRPNVVFILSDDQSWDDYGFMGHLMIRAASFTLQSVFTNFEILAGFSAPRLSPSKVRKANGGSDARPPAFRALNEHCPHKLGRPTKPLNKSLEMRGTRR